MSTDPHVCVPAAVDLDIVLLAAGGASRYGSAKQLARIDGVAMVRRTALTALATGARLTVVIGAHGDAVAEQLAGLPLSLAENSDWVHGMGASIACGVRQVLAAHPTTPAVLIALADQPRVTADDLARLIADHRRAPERIVAADHGACLGPPCIFPPSCYAELMALSGERGARYLFGAGADAPRTVAMANAAFDVDTIEDFASVAVQNASR